MELTIELVACVYRCMLGRYPESNQVVEEKIKAFPTLDDLILSVSLSAEHSLYHAKYNDIVANSYLSKSGQENIHYDLSEATINSLFEKLQKQWCALGDSDPYWSVLTNDIYKSDKIELVKDKFFQSGHREINQISRFFERNNKQVPSEHCVELGCGVGRITIPLSRFFERVTALDVSKGNLDICLKNISDENISNVSCNLVRSANAYDYIPEHDFFYSVIVLQHNPPPLQDFILNKILTKTRKGGYCLFQIPTHTPGYEFKTDDFLKKKEEIMDMHCLPMQTVFSILSRYGFQPIEVVCDHYTGMYGSYTFFAQRS